MEDIFLLSIRTHITLANGSLELFAVQILGDKKVPILNISHEFCNIINCTSFLRGHKQPAIGTTASIAE